MWSNRSGQPYDAKINACKSSRNASALLPLAPAQSGFSARRTSIITHVLSSHLSFQSAKANPRASKRARSGRC